MADFYDKHAADGCFIEISPDSLDIMKDPSVVKKLTDVISDYIKIQKTGKLEYLKKFCIKNLNSGDYAAFDTKEPTKIYINKSYLLEAQDTCILTAVLHENVHSRDDKDRGIIKTLFWPTEENAAKLVFGKILRPYSTSLPAEAFTCLAEAIETPNDADKDNPLSDKIRLRIDENGNYVLMLHKDHKYTKNEAGNWTSVAITEREFSRLGTFCRKYRCPKLIPDYDPKKHGELSNYYSTIIRTADPDTDFVKNFANINFFEFSRKRKIKSLLDDNSLTLNNIESISSLPEMQYNFFNKYFKQKGTHTEYCITETTIENLASADEEKIRLLSYFMDLRTNIKNARKDCEILLELSTEELKKIYDKFNNYELSGRDLFFMAKLEKEELKNIEKRKLLDITDNDGTKIENSEVIIYACLTDDQWANIQEFKLIEKLGIRVADYYSDFKKDILKEAMPLLELKNSKGYNYYWFESVLETLLKTNIKINDNEEITLAEYILENPEEFQEFVEKPEQNKNSIFSKYLNIHGRPQKIELK